MGGGSSGLGAAGLQVFSKLVPFDGGLGLEARAGRLLFAPILDDRTHLGAARASIGLRKRSAGAAAEMMESLGHWNVIDDALCRRHAKCEFAGNGEDQVTRGPVSIEPLCCLFRAGAEEIATARRRATLDAWPR